ncbi:serine/threonine-protein kinase [Pseudonocardia acaciae]|uniref:serine/threonine-protein kinase n=1 Tax=Pseudonocardia acaciae TaxID=551276 RepID=UPI000AF2350D|nr:serine/threonine-protein kinase [Pseudonocardia acaciae]
MEPLRDGDPGEVGRYRLVGRLHANDNCEVFLGRAPDGVLAAVRVMHASHALSARFRARFAREVALVAAIRTPWAAPVLDSDAEAATPWVASEYVAGPALAEVVARTGPLPEAQVGVIGARLAAALAELHALGGLHGDLKPSHVLIAADGPRLIDFEVGRAVDATATLIGARLSVPAFTSPEQALGEDAVPASDVFSLAGVLAYAASGREPFGLTGNPVAMVRRITDEHPELSGVPHALARVLQPCLAKQPATRPTAADLVTRFARWARAPLAEAWPSGHQDLWIETF